MLPSDVLHYDPQTKHYTTGTSRQEEAAKPTDRTSRLSELAGEFMVQPSIAGAAKAAGPVAGWIERQTGYGGTRRLPSLSGTIDPATLRGSAAAQHALSSLMAAPPCR